MRLPINKPLLCCLLLVAGLAPAAPATAASPAPPAAPAVTQAAWAAGPAPVLVADNWWTWSSIYRGLESCLSSRAGLLRVGVIGMVIALVIIMFGNKWGK